MTQALSIGNINTPAYQASKWIELPALLDEKEMELLLSELGSFFIYRVGKVEEKGAGLMDQKEFLSHYQRYVQVLKERKLPDERRIREELTSVWTVDPDHLYVFPLSKERQLIKVSKPVVQVQLHAMSFSSHDQRFRSMMFGQESIPWGVQFSYPQIYQDPKTNQVKKVVEGEEFPNSTMFRTIQKWFRRNTVPTPFLIDGKVVRSPIRLGKLCFSWIHQHCQLQKKQLEILKNGTH